MLVYKQLPIDEQSRKAILTARQNIFYDATDELAEQMFTGQISMGQWQERMKSEIRMFHNSAAAIGKGGWDNMGPRDWGRLGTPLREQYRYLQGFAEHISNNRDVVSLKYLKARARLYGEGAIASAVQAEAGFTLEELLPWLPRDGSTLCLNRCHCKWLLHVVRRVGSFNIVHAIWKLGEADHCETCKGRQEHLEVLRVPVDVSIPPQIGGY